MIATQWWRSGGTAGVDDAFARQFAPGIGAESMGSASPDGTRTRGRARGGPPGPRATRTSGSEVGPTVIRDFLTPGLIDHLPVVLVPSCSAGAYASGSSRGRRAQRWFQQLGHLFLGVAGMNAGITQ
jgi:hypothetical protein